MPRPLTLLLSIFLLCAGYAQAQTTSSAQKSTFQVSATSAWTDTGMDLQSGDAVEISATSSAADGESACDPKGLSSPSSDLPLPSAPAGALLARLHAQGAVPLLVGAGTELKIEEPSHLFLGMNMAEAAPCQGSLTVRVRVIPAGTSATSVGSSTSEPQSKTRGEQLKSQLGTAAQVFMQGQFGFGNKSEATASNSAAAGTTGGADASPALALTVSNTPL